MVAMRQLVTTLLVCIVKVFMAEASLVPAFFIFGDSTVDTGNQNYITSVIKSNFQPYGLDFHPPGPTGRFSNGKLANDFIAEFLELPSPPNFLDKGTVGSKLLQGVNMASSGSGYLDYTGQLLGVKNLTTQLIAFGKIKESIVEQVGEFSADALIRNSLYLFSTGSNDFVNSYNINPILQKEFSPAQYQKKLLSSIYDNLKTLYEYGARKLVIDSLGPIGCVPEQLTLYNSKNGECFENVNKPLRDFNDGLVSLLETMRGEYPDYHLTYGNVYDKVYQAIQNPEQFGFKYGNVACCGEGGNFKGLPCLPPSPICSNRDDYVFFDLFHPSQKMYNILAQGAIYGGGTEIFPYNILQLIQL